MTDLGVLRGDLSYYDINDAGQVVAWTVTGTGAWQGFITGPDGVGMTDLNSLVELPAGVFLGGAVGINNVGQVVAVGNIGVVPEPESYAMMLAGLILTGVMVRQKHLVA